MELLCFCHLRQTGICFNDLDRCPCITCSAHQKRLVSASLIQTGILLYNTNSSSARPCLLSLVQKSGLVSFNYVHSVRKETIIKSVFLLILKADKLSACFGLLQLFSPFQMIFGFQSSLKVISGFIEIMIKTEAYQNTDIF